MPVKIPESVMERAGLCYFCGPQALDPNKLARADILAILEINPEPEAPFGGEWDEQGDLRIGCEAVAYIRQSKSLTLRLVGLVLSGAQAREIITAWESRPAGCKTLRAAWEAREGGR